MTELTYLGRQSAVYPCRQAPGSEDWTLPVGKQPLEPTSSACSPAPKRPGNSSCRRRTARSSPATRPTPGWRSASKPTKNSYRDRLPYNCIQWAAKFEDGSGWQGSIPVLDWCNLAWGLRSIHDDDNQIINWLWIKAKEAVE